VRKTVALCLVLLPFTALAQEEFRPSAGGSSAVRGPTSSSIRGRRSA
jgi:hypothetical protein